MESEQLTPYQPRWQLHQPWTHAPWPEHPLKQSLEQTFLQPLPKDPSTQTQVCEAPSHRLLGLPRFRLGVRMQRPRPEQPRAHKAESTHTAPARTAPRPRSPAPNTPSGCAVTSGAEPLKRRPRVER